MSDRDESRNPDLDWENRVLCSDEACIGTVGPDGRCKECGRPYEGLLPGAHDQPGEDEVPVSNADRPEEVPDARERIHPPASADEEWERRTLCSDESCIGVIGPDGRCKECGKAFHPKD